MALKPVLVWGLQMFGQEINVHISPLGGIYKQQQQDLAPF